MNIAIIGAGISGVSAAYLLSDKSGVNVTIFEKADQPGGCIRSFSKDGYLVESGPNGILNTRKHAIDLFKKADVKGIQLSSDCTTKRYIQLNHKLHAAPSGPASAVTTGLLSFGGKLRILKEPFSTAKTDDSDESVLSFATRRLGREAAENLIATLIGGIYAGDADKISVKSAFPSLYELEHESGSIIKGMFAKMKQAKNSGNSREKRDKDSSKLVSSNTGMQGLVRSLAQNTKNVNFEYNTKVESINKSENSFVLTVNGDTREFDKVIICANAHDASELIKNIDENTEKELNKVVFAPIYMCGMGFERIRVKHPLDGFGFLVAPKDKGMMLGCLFSSSLFDMRAPKDKVLLTAICVGDRNREYFSRTDEELNALVLAQLKKMLDIDGTPETIAGTRSEKAIPQYYIGHEKIVAAVADFEKQNEGIYLAGNTCHGISVADCIKTSIETVERLLNASQKA